MSSSMQWNVNWKVVTYVGMFALTYGVFVKVRAPAEFTASSHVATAADELHAAAGAGVQRGAGQSVTVPSAATSAYSAASVTSSAPVTPERQQLVRELSQVAMQSDDVDERIVALRQLNETHTEDALQALARVLQTDDAARNRLQAISSLRQLGLQADNDGRIRALLRAAQQDADANVANTALDAAQQLERKYGS